MPSNYHYISADIKKQILIMARSLKPLDIARVTNISVRTVYRVMSLASRTGNVVQVSHEEGRPRALTSLDLDVSIIEILLDGLA